MKTAKKLKIDLWQNRYNRINSMEIKIKDLRILLRNDDQEIANTLKTLLNEVEIHNGKAISERIH